MQTSNLNSEIRNNQKMGQRPTAETRTESYPNIEDKANLTTIGCREPGIQVARPLKTTDDLFDSRSSPRTESLVAAAVQWAERIMRRILGSNLNVHVGVGYGFARIEPAEVVTSCAKRNVVLVVGDSRLAFRSRNQPLSHRLPPVTRGWLSFANKPVNLLRYFLFLRLRTKFIGIKDACELKNDLIPETESTQLYGNDRHGVVEESNQLKNLAVITSATMTAR